MQALVLKSMLALVMGVGVMMSPNSVQGQEWPSRTITWMVPFPAGGTVDQPARLMAEYLRQAMNWQIVVENRPGASGMIGTSQVARAQPDGYTWGFVFDTHVTNPSLQHKIPFDTLRDIQPVMLLGRVPFVMVTNPEQPYRTVADLMEAAKTRPGAISYAVTGLGTLAHLTMMQLQDAHNLSLVAVPYRGGPPAVQDVIANHVPLYIGSPTLVTEHIKAGRLRALAYTGSTRSSLLPDVPTLAEQGLAVSTAQAFIGVIGPAGIPKDILDRFFAALLKAANDDRTRKWLIEVGGMEVVAAGPDQFRAYIESEMAKWGAVIKTHNIRAE